MSRFVTTYEKDVICNIFEHYQLLGYIHQDDKEAVYRILERIRERLSSYLNEVHGNEPVKLASYDILDSIIIIVRDMAELSACMDQDKYSTYIIRIRENIKKLNGLYDNYKILLQRQ
jgi:hypothetical protein